MKKRTKLFETKSLLLVSWLEYLGYPLMKFRSKKGVAVFGYDDNDGLRDAVDDYSHREVKVVPRELFEASRKIASWSKRRVNQGVFKSNWLL